MNDSIALVLVLLVLVVTGGLIATRVLPTLTGGLIGALSIVLLVVLWPVDGRLR